MPAWSDPGHWQALCAGTACPICLRAEPLDRIATLSASWVTMQERAAARGYVCVVSRTHAVELHDPGDHFGEGPIDPGAVVQPVYAKGEFARIRRAVLEALA